MAIYRLNKRSWFVIGSSLTVATFVVLSLEREESTPEIPPSDSQTEEVSALNIDPESIELIEASSAPNTTSPPTPDFNEPDITQISPEAIWNKYIQRAEEGDLDAIYVLAFILNECRNTGTEGFIDRIQRSNLTIAIKEHEVSRFKRCMPLISKIDDPKATYDRLYQTLHDEVHPVTMVNVPGLPPVSRKDRLVLAVMGDYPEQFMYAKAYLAAVVYHREYVDYPDVYRQEAWTILYCEASLKCNSNEYRENLQSAKYHPHEYNAILDIEKSIRGAIQDRDSSALGF